MTRMNRTLVLGIVASCCTMIGTPAFAQAQNDGTTINNAKPAAPVNAMCPIGKEPIVPSVKTIEYKGRTIGFCCPGCGDKFMGWDESKRDKFVLLAVAGTEPGQKQAETAPKAQSAQRSGDPYTLGACPISGKKLGAMGDAIVKVYDGREVRFCCKMCIKKFEADPAAGFEKIDEQIIASQMRYYPLETCIISGEQLGSEEMGDTIELVYNNRLVRFCCKMCRGDFQDDPDAYLAKLDKAVADAQRDDYPLSTCVVAGGELGSMGDPEEIVVGNRLVKFCCAGCTPKFEADPASFLAQLDAAWNANGKFMP